MISPDGRWLTYNSDDSGRFEVYVRPFPRGAGKWQVSAGGGRLPVWSRNRPELFYGNNEGIMVANYIVEGGVFVPNKSRLWAGKKDLGYFDLSPDGNRFVVAEEEPSQQKEPPRVNLLLNFFDELRRRAPAGSR